MMATPFRKIRRIGSGGFGEVSLCERTSDGAEFALKELIDTSDPEGVKRFVREVRILSSLDHPNIVKVIRADLQAAPYSYAMPLYATSLEDELPATVGNSQRIQAIASRILDGLEYAHAKAVVHRDLKPANVLMNPDTDLVLSDFGLGRQFDSRSTRQTQTGQSLGTFLYMAPEQFDDAKIADARSDVFSFGRMLYELQTGSLPIGQLDLKRLPGPIALIVARCTQNDPERRFQTVAELKSAWKRLADAAAESSEGDEFNKLVEALSSTKGWSTADIGRFRALLVTRLGDPDLVHMAVMGLSSAAFQSLWEVDPDLAGEAIRRFIEHAATAGWDFAHTDQIASQCEELLATTEDSSLRAGLIWCMVAVGANHNRFNVMRRAASLLESVESPADLLELAARLATLEPHQMDNFSGYLENKKLAPVLRALFPKA